MDNVVYILEFFTHQVGWSRHSAYSYLENAKTRMRFEAQGSNEYEWRIVKELISRTTVARDANL